MNTQQDLSKQDLSRRVWKEAGPASGTPAGKRQLQVRWREQLFQDILEWAGSLPRQRGTLGLWDRQGTHPSATSIWGMFWVATPQKQAAGLGNTRSLGGQGAARKHCHTKPCPCHHAWMAQ